MGFRHQGRKTTSLIHPVRQTLVWSIAWSRNVQRLRKDVNTGTRRIETLTQVVDELLRQAFDESSNEMVCMSIEVSCKKASRLVSSSQGVPEVPTATGDTRISSITKATRCTELCDYASRRLFATRASGAAQEKQLGSKRPSTRPRGGWTCSVRGQHKHGRSRETPQQQAPPDMQTGQSSRACLCREVPADHEAHSRPQRGQLRRNECRSHSRVVTTLTELRRDRDPEAEAVTRRSRADECTIAGSQAEQSQKRGAERRLRTDLRGKDSNDEAFPATYKSGPHVARRNPRPCRR